MTERRVVRPDSMKDAILFYENTYYMFSNFSSFMVNWRDQDWMTSEHAYQAAKFIGTSPDLFARIALTRSAHDAFKLARSQPELVRSDWDEVKIPTMEDIVRCKLQQHPYIQVKLRESGDKLIVENSPVDGFWGRGSDWQGRNELGKVWMRLREEMLGGEL